MNNRKSALLWIAGGVGGAACFAALVWGTTSFLAPRSGNNTRGNEVACGDFDRVGARVEFRNEVPPMPAPPFMPLERDAFDIDEVGGGGPAPAFDFALPARSDERPVMPEEVKASRGPAVASKEQTISGPFTHGQLSVFLVHGKGTRTGADVLTLQEALERGVATVHEGGISVDNRSDKALFIQSGDVIKGGTQDRTLPYDQLIPANAKRVPLEVFCVEAGRSFPRAGEISTSFAVSNERLPTRALRLAAYQRSQGDVWKNVASLQTMLSRETGGDVRGKLSTTSLQLTLEHPLVQNNAQVFLNRLLRSPDKNDDVLGAVFVINGKVASADVYSSPELFQKFWPKLLKAAAVEAIAEGPRESSIGASVEDVRNFLACDSIDRAFRQDSGGLAHMIRGETRTAYVFDTCTSGVVMHRSLIAR